MTKGRSSPSFSAPGSSADRIRSSHASSGIGATVRNLLQLVNSLNEAEDRSKIAAVARKQKSFDVCKIDDYQTTSANREALGAAVLLGVGLAASSGLDELIRTSAPIISIELPHEDWVAPMSLVVATWCKAIRACENINDRHGHAVEQTNQCPAGVIVLNAYKDDLKYSTQFEDQVHLALDAYRPLIIILAPGRKLSGHRISDAIDYQLVIQNFSSETIGMLISHFFGVNPTRQIPEIIAQAIEPIDLRFALHIARGVDESIDRIIKIVEARQRISRAGEGPKLEDLSGYGAAAEWGLAAAADIAAYGRSELPWTACEPGVLLKGPPGVGKTMFASALARQAGVSYLSGSLAQWQSVGEAHLGTTLKAMRQFFDEARRLSPCIALIDELDSFGDRRESKTQNHQYHVQIVNGFLECLDGREGRAGVVLVGATNHPDRIDPAILRSGRFDRSIHIDLPSVSDIESIFRHHLGDDLVGTDITSAARAAFTGTGADCAAWVRRARGKARRAGRAVEFSDLLAAIADSKDEIGPKHSLRAAYHESGRAIVAHTFGAAPMDLVLRPCSAPYRRSNTDDLPGEMTRQAASAILTLTLAGRAAEILLLGTPSSNSAADLRFGSAFCMNMHCHWGLGDGIAVRDIGWRPDIEALVEQELKDALERATSILQGKKSKLVHLGRLLFERGSMTGSEISLLLGPEASNKMEA